LQAARPSRPAIVATRQIERVGVIDVSHDTRVAPAAHSARIASRGACVPQLLVFIDAAATRMPGAHDRADHHQQRRNASFSRVASVQSMSINCRLLVLIG
jgi:hypothetical protein